MNDNEEPLRRLNGRLQACDQCRARKVACDHSRPTCSRCLKRNQADECTYTVGSVLQPRRRVRRQNIKALNPRDQEPSPTQSHVNGDANASASVNTNANANGSPRSGYMGFTSHTILYEQTKRSLSLLQGQGADSQLPQFCADDRMSPRHSFSELPHIVRHMSIYVLEALPGQCNEQIVFQNESHQRKGWAQVALTRITKSVEDLLQKSPDGTGPDLERIAEMICNNSAQPLRDIDDQQQWMDQFCGMNLRWESIGLIWANLERISDTMNSFRPCHVGWIPGKGSRDVSRTYITYCIDLSRHFSEGNAVLLDLHRRRTTLLSVLDGDASASCWYSHGAAVSMMTFMGLHVLEKEVPYTPTLCSENNRRLAAQIFNSDKFCVAFSGRPPLLNRRYCTTPLPLDLREEDLVADEATLKKAAEDLDERGWNRQGVINPVTLIRARRMLAAILEEVMDVALGCRVCITLDELRFGMLTLTLTLWTHKDRFAAMRRNFEWLLMAHAAPAGGILCLELLNPTFTGKHPRDPRITRSSIIQNLSLLVGFLDWVRPSAPNGDLCMDCKVIIQRVLDHTLNGSVDDDSPRAALAYAFPEPLDFNFELLDTFDWLHTDV
ncbi:hypothetical protein TARUN_3587 [Trichoderma arundinaceum]|uniref:Zn(2)-C6 fungal-type domain-containing protein n=1 Tax=Trichoderma arundinaceum TaxID=490622 RepID=A0A395NS20_TRIAR|nr:hypothetical protein TARUN_3587 [Trichoderma arundinaceum]